MPSYSYDEQDIERRTRESEEEEAQFKAVKQQEYDESIGDAPPPQLTEEQEQTAEQQRISRAGEAEPPAGLQPGIQQWLEENVAIPAQDFVDNVFQGDQKTPQQIADERTQQRLEYQERAKETQEAFEKAAYEGPINTVGSEAVRTVVSLPTKLIEAGMDTTDLMVDIGRVGIDKVRGIQTKPTENPFDDRYIAAAYDLGVKGPKTQAGQLAAKLLQFATVTRRLMVSLPKGLTSLGTKPGTLRRAIAEGIIPGAIADFFLTDDNSGNLSTMVNNFIPEDNLLHDSFLFALRTTEDDDLFTAKIKSVLEGGVVGAAADALLWLSWGRKAAQRASAAGASQEEAFNTGMKEAKTKMEEVDKNDLKLQAEERERFLKYNSDELDQLLQMKRKLEIDMSRFRAEGNQEQLKYIQETLDDVNLHIAEVDEKLMKGYQPNDIRGVPQEQRSAYNKPAQPDLAIRQQLQGELPPKEAVEGVYAPFDRKYMNEQMGSYHMMTDAQMKLMQYSDEQVKLIQATSKDVHLQKIANDLQRPVADIVNNAAKMVSQFQHALRSDVPSELLEDMFDKAGMLNPKTVKGSKILSKEGVLVTKALISDAATQIHDLARNAVELRSSGQPVGNQLDRALDRLVTLLEFHKTTAYEYGSGLEIFGHRIEEEGLLSAMFSRGGSEMSIREARQWAYNIKAAMRKGDPEAMDDAMRLVNNMLLAGGDPTKQVQFLSAAFNLGVKQSTKALYQSLLSAPVTHAKNAFGNAYSLYERPLSTFLRSFKPGQKHGKEIRAAAISGVHAMTTGIGDAFKIAKTTFVRGTSANFNSKFALQDFEVQAQLKQLDAVANTWQEKAAAGLLKNHYRFLNNPWMSWPSNALMASDDFFKSLAARYRMYSKAKYEAMIHAADDTEVDGLFKSYLEKSSKMVAPDGRILDKDLLDYSERITFQQDPGAFLNTVSRAVDLLPLGMGKLFLPFIRTPGNLFGYGMEHLPGANQFLRKFDDTYKEAVKNKDYLLMAEMEGRSATGVMIASAFMTAGMFTEVTGNYPYDPNERAAWKAAGIPPFSIRVGDAWVSYASFEPVNSMLSVVADIQRLAKAGHTDFMVKVAHQFGYSITAAYTDKSMLKGLTELGELLSPQNMRDPSQLRFALNSFNNYVPYAGFRRTFSNAFDPYYREMHGEVDRVLKSAVPTFGTGMFAETSFITGKPLPTAAGGLFNAVSPIRITAVNDNPVEKELADIGYNSNNVLKQGSLNVELKPKQQEALAKIMHKLGVGRELKAYMNSEKYKALKEAYKGRSFSFTNMVEGSDDAVAPHVAEIQRIISKAKSKALKQLEKVDQEYLMEVARKRYIAENAGRFANFTEPSYENLRKYAGLD